MFERLAVGQAGAENRANVAQQASQNMVDMLMLDRGRVMTTVTNAGGVVNNVDNRQVDSSTTYHQTFVDQGASQVAAGSGQQPAIRGVYAAEQSEPGADDGAAPRLREPATRDAHPLHAEAG